MLINILVDIVGILVFLFLFFRRLKEDYSSEIIFSAAFLSLVAMGVGFFLSKIFLHNWWFWLSALGSFIGLGVSILIYKMKFYESLEAYFLAYSPWIAMEFLKDSTINFSLISFIGFIVTMLIIGLFYFLETKYKKISWYRSGRVGFSGLTTAAIFFLLRAAISPFYPNLLTFSGSFEYLFSGLVAFILFFLVYNLAIKI